MISFNTLHLLEHLLLLSLLIHEDDSSLPFFVIMGYGKTDIGDGSAIARWYPPADHLYQYAPVGLVLELIGQLGFPFKLLEKDMGRATAHLDLSHLLFVYKLNGGIPELLPEHLGKGVPTRVSISRPCLVVNVLIRGGTQAWVNWVIPVDIAKVYPPVFHFPFEEGNSKAYHQGGHPLIVQSERLEVLGAGPKESLNVVMLPFKELGKLHEGRLDHSHSRRVVFVPYPDGSVGRRGAIIVGQLRH